MTYGNPHLVVNRPSRQPKISVILIDWGVRESFHGVEYLNRQTAARADYELIWLEFYDREPEGLHRLVAANEGGAAVLDKWIVLGYPDDLIFHKHRLYNVGLLAAAGDICVICDSDAIFRPTFIERLTRQFEETPDGVIHVDEVRNTDRRFYPFNYPTIADILGPGCINWRGTTTAGVVDREDRIHSANYGACLAARRQDLLAIGGADEHLDYLGYVCGPYDLTFRLVNRFGRPERWLADEYLYHVWHPNASGSNTDYQGPHDTKFMALRALDARASLRIEPWLRNPWIDRDAGGQTLPLDRLLPLMAAREEPDWKQGAQPAGLPDTVYCVEKNFAGHSIFYHAGSLYALPEKHTMFDPERAGHGGYADLLAATDLDALQAMILARAFGAASGGGLGGLLRRIRAQPLHRLPARLLRKGRRLVASWRRAQANAGVLQPDQQRTAKIGGPS